MPQDHDGPYNAESNQVAAAQAQLEVARRSGEVGSIALAHLNLAATLAAVGDDAAAIEEFESVLEYTELAAGDEERETRRMLRRMSPAAPPPGVDDIDLLTVATVARLGLAECLLHLGRREEARLQIERAAPGTKGLGRGPLRRRLGELRARLDNPMAGSREAAPDAGPVEIVAAADDLLAAGKPDEAARRALRAIDLCSPEDTLVRGQARQLLGMALLDLGRGDDALAVLRDGLQDYLDASAYPAAVDLAIAVAWLLADRGDIPGARDLLSGTAATVGSAAGVPARVRLLVDLGSLQDRAGDPARARTTLTGAVATAADVDDPVLRADARHGLAIVLATTASDPDDSVEALSLLDSCRRDYETAGMPDRAVGCDHEAAALLGRLGSRAAAAARYERALQGYRDLPEEARDTGAWPDEVADCELNLAALTDDRADLSDDPRLFRSGGHTMSHG